VWEGIFKGKEGKKEKIKSCGVFPENHTKFGILYMASSR
jgi:hypothetical protein